MLEILTRSIARAGGIEVPEDVRVIGDRRPSPLRRLADRFGRWYDRRSTLLVLQALDDRTLRDVGLDRSSLYQVANNLSRPAATNDNRPPKEAKAA